MLAAARGLGLPLRGVVHAAGVLDDGTLLEQNEERLGRVMAPKALGASLLAELAPEHELDHFILFSSAASLLGSSGQTNYAAANAFLDGLAADLRSRGLPALSINWGPWAEVGMAARLAARERGRMAEKGTTMIGPELGLAALEMLLDGEVPQAAVLPVDWAKVLEQVPVGKEPPLLRALANLREAQSSAGELRGQALRDQLTRADPADRLKLLETFVQQQIARSLGLSNTQSVDIDAPMGATGLDSLMALELRNRIETELGVTTQVSRLLGNGTVGELAGELGTAWDLNQSADTLQWLKEANDAAPPAREDREQITL
jgi:hypothetical protein